MNLYRVIETGQWFGTQGEANAAIRASGGGSWLHVDVPTDKAGLLCWLNKSAGLFAAAATRNVVPIADLMPPIAGTIAIEEQIAEADLPNAIRLASHALCRVQEHLNANARSAS